MKCSALEFYVIVVYGVIRGIYNGKAWMKTMNIFQSVAATLLQTFLSIRQKAFDGIKQYSKQLISNCSTLSRRFSHANRHAVQGNDGVVQYLTPKPLVLTLARNACSYQVCLHSVIVVQLPTLMAKEMSLH